MHPLIRDVVTGREQPGSQSDSWQQY